jgi:glycine betaine/proline transport system permease protein/glycine betaine/proline transport system substrate-binding protein
MRRQCMKNKFLLLILSSMISIVFAAGCAFGGPATILVTDCGWDSQKIHNEIAKFIIENGFDGYVVEASTGSSLLNWQALAAGDVDLQLETWPDNIAPYREDVKNGDVIELGVIVDTTAQGFYVPRYVVEGDPERGIAPMAPDLKTVEDLKKYPKLFKDPEDPSKGRLYGAVPGWYIDQIMFKKHEFYGLNKDYIYFRCGSEAVLFASLASAYNLGDPWVGYCWEPAWVIGKFDLILLEDAPYDPELFADGKCEVPNQALTNVSSGKFASRAPDLVDFISNYKTGSQKISEALAYLEETNASHENVATWFMKQNDDLLDQWLKPEQAARVRKALAGK